MEHSTLKLVFSDFDGTLTHGCCLGPVFFDVIDLLNQHNIPLIIVTGRSRAWGHFFITHIKTIEAVIAEGGGVLIERGQNSADLVETALVSKDVIAKIESFTELLLETFPEVELSVDSSGRLVDRAIELELLKDESLKQKITDLMDQHDINYSCSNVHLNYWVSDISKAKSVKDYLVQKNYNQDTSEYVYFGDSLNDESMFGYFKHSVGVSNISSVLEKMTDHPSVILKGKENEGPFGVLNHLQALMNQKTN